MFAIANVGHEMGPRLLMKSRVGLPNRPQKQTQQIRYQEKIECHRVADGSDLVQKTGAEYGNWVKIKQVRKTTKWDTFPPRIQPTPSVVSPNDSLGTLA